MSRLKKYKNVWRVALLILLAAAILGPWGFDRIMVPAKYPCSATSIRLDDDFCGTPLSGTWMLGAAIIEFSYRVVGLVTGTMTLIELAIGFRFFLYVLALVLPFFSTLLLILAENRRRQVFSIAAWGLAAVIYLLALAGMPSYPKLYLLWGIWLYIGLVASALILEVLILARTKSP